MRLCFIDFETQGVDPTQHLATEVGVTIVDCKANFEQVDSQSWLLWDQSYPPQPEEIVELTGISDELLRGEGMQPKPIFEQLISPWIANADYVLAHNRAFDEAVYRETCKRVGLEAAEPKGRWLCTIQDIPWPKKYKCKKLSHLAFDHGIVSDPTQLHRANYDTDLLARLVTQKCDIDAVIAYANTPWVVVSFKRVSAPWEDGGKDNAIVKSLGFSWEKIWGTEQSFPKRWVKRIKETELAAEKGKIPAHLTLTRLTGDLK